MKNIIWVVINPNGTYAGVPCESWEEARELAAQDEGRRVYILCPREADVTGSSTGLI